MEFDRVQKKRHCPIEFQKSKDDFPQDCGYDKSQIDRYNGRRLNRALNQRVPNHLFPDATLYAWEFTGSSEADQVEYFQKNLGHGRVKLDFYFTEGTVKTVKIDPIEGDVELFGKGKQLLPSVYIKILQTPLSHTDIRYGRRMD
jgi:hypothetical protein